MITTLKQRQVFARDIETNEMVFLNLCAYETDDGRIVTIGNYKLDPVEQRDFLRVFTDLVNGDTNNA